MTSASKSQPLYNTALSHISYQLSPTAFENIAWLWALPFDNVWGEEYVAQDGALLADNVQQQQRRQWGVELIPPFHPSSSALAPAMEQFQWFWLSSANADSVPDPSCYPTPESLSDSPTHNDLLDVVLDDGFEWSIFSSPNLTNFEQIEGYPDSLIDVPPDRDNCPPRRETPTQKNYLLAGQDNASATKPTSSADGVEAATTSSNIYNQPSEAEGQAKGAASAGVAPPRSSSPSIIPALFPPSWRAHDPTMTLPSPASSTSTIVTPSPVTSSTTMSRSPSFTPTPSIVPSQRHKRRRNEEDMIDNQPEKKRKRKNKNPKKRKDTSNDFFQENVSGWENEDGINVTRGKFRNTFAEKMRMLTEVRR